MSGLAPLRFGRLSLPPVTATLIGLCLVAFVWQIVHGAGVLDADARELLPLGANYTPALAAGEYWRLLSCLFLHGGLVHLLLNLLALADLGSAVERNIGAARTFAAFLVCGVVGGLASALRQPEAISIGASGAIFGLFAIWLVDAAGHADAPSAIVRRRRLMLAAYAVVALGSGFLFVGIDNAAHFGGFAAGLVLGLADRRSPALATATAGLALAGVVLALTLLPERWARPYVESQRFDALYHQYVLDERRVNDALQRLVRDAQQRRAGEADILLRLDRDILPAVRAGHALWRDARFAHPDVDKERAFWLQYSRLRLHAIIAFRSAIATGNPVRLREFESRMGAAAAMIASLDKRRTAPTGLAN